MTRHVLIFALLASCRGEPERPAQPVALPAPRVDGRPAIVDGSTRAPRIASYAIRAELDTATHRIGATETLRWRHTGSTPVTGVPRPLYMNAFKDDSTVFARESGGGSLRGMTSKEAGDSGSIDLASIVVGGVELRPQARYGADETTLEVPLPRPVAPGEELVVEMRFTTQ